MSQLDDVQVQAEKIRARVVFNSRTGTVVMGDGVALHAAAVSHGSLTVSINETSNVSQPNAFAGGRTAVTPQSNIAVNHARPGVVSLPESSSLKTLVNALNSLGATPDDIMSILQALHEAGDGICRGRTHGRPEQFWVCLTGVPANHGWEEWPPPTVTVA